MTHRGTPAILAARQPGVPNALEMRGIFRRFGAMTALDDVTLTVRTGTVHALLGENGAGKSTLMRIAYGLEVADAGAIAVAQRATSIASPADAIASGIGMVHQHFTLVPAMTVAENLALGGHGVLRPRDVARRVAEVSVLTGFVLDPSARVEALSVGAQQRVEIAKALMRGARFLILDEPTAVLAPAEAEELLRWLRRFVGSGNAAVLITHKLREALAVADDVTVLRRGHVMLHGPARETTRESLTRAMLGDGARGSVDAGAAAPPARRPLHQPPIVFRAQHVAVRDAEGLPRVRDANFTVNAGEIIGVIGVEGSGQRELLRILAGRLPITAGHLVRPADVGFVPEDRHRDAVMLQRSLTENVALRGAGARRGLSGWPALHIRTAALMRAFDVRAPDARASMQALSGGNQQKLVLAREIGDRRHGVHAASETVALVVENPTRGLDVRAMADVHARLRNERDAGAAIVLYSSDLDEVLSLADRLLAVYDGSVREVPLDREAAGRAMIGLA